MDFFIKILVCFLAGLGAGLGTGFAGLSACAVIGPMLITFLDIPAYQAVGIGLASDVLASAISAYTYKKKGNIDIKNSLVLMICVLSMTILGSFIGRLVPENTIGGLSQVMLLLLGIKFIIKPINNQKFSPDQHKNKKWLIKSIICGLYIGFICGFIGAGGGMMMLFVLTTVLGYQMHVAVGTSVFIMSFTALTGGITHFVVGGVPDLTCLIACMIFTLTFAKIASVIANKASAKTLNRIVGIIMTITSIVILTVEYLL